MDMIVLNFLARRIFGE